MRATMDLRFVKLTRGQFALVDPSDLLFLRRHTWHAHWKPNGKCHYAKTNLCERGKWRVDFMHRLLLGLQPGDGKHVDHINRNTLDNRRENLRICTPAQNATNRKGQSQLGCCIEYNNAGSRKYVFRITRNKRRHYVGSYATLMEAQEAKAAWLEAHGEGNA